MKLTRKKLKLNKETLRRIDNAALKGVMGGFMNSENCDVQTNSGCFVTLVCTPYCDGRF